MVGVINKIFWGIAALEALFFVVAFLMTANQGGQNPDGGKAMSIIFLIGVPVLILGFAALIYWNASSPVLKIGLLIGVTIPMMWLGNRWVQSARYAKEAAEGYWIYDDPQPKALLAAIYNLDVKRVRDLAAKVNINAEGQDHWTPLKFAIRNAVDNDTPGRVDIVRTLLSVGATPNQGLVEACGFPRGDIAKLLFDAGADANFKDELGTPAFFGCVHSIRPVGVESLRLFAAQGADFNLPGSDGKSAMELAAIYSRWDAALFLLDQGANPERVLQIVEKAMENKPLKDELQQLGNRLKSLQSK